MEINPLSSYIPNAEGRRKPTDKEVNTQPPATDAYVGPNTEAKINQLKDLDSERQDLIDHVQKEINEGVYFSDERIANTIEELLKNL